jgi:DNA-directed RNA polymerase specialized sigma24 family protein
MRPAQAVSEAEQNEVILRIYASARAQSAAALRLGLREDLIHDFILECLVSMRRGSLTRKILNVHAFVKVCLRYRRIDSWRHELAQMERDAMHLAEIRAAPREWMDQGLKIEEDRLRRFAARVFDSVDPRSVEIHHLLRDEQFSYRETAECLGGSIERIHKHVGLVQRAFRQAMPAIGLTPPVSSRGGRLVRPVKGAARRRRRRIRQGFASTSLASGVNRVLPPSAVREFWSFPAPTRTTRKPSPRNA